MSLTGNAFSEKDSGHLVSSIGDDPVWWSSLQDPTFAIVALAFISTDICKARDVGLIRLFRALESIKGGLDVARRTALKISVAKMIILP